MEEYGGVGSLFHSFLTSTLNEGERSASRPNLFISPVGKRPLSPFSGDWLDVRAGMDVRARMDVRDVMDVRDGMDAWRRESVFCLELNHDSSVVQPVDKSLCQLSYPASVISMPM
jgi:hypothetical protein